MSPFVIVALRSSQSFIVGLGTVYVGIRHRLAPAFVFVTVLTVVVCLTTSWWVYPPLTAIVTGSMSPLTKTAILVLVMFHIVRVVARASPKLTLVRRHSWRSLRAPLDGGCRVRGAEAEAYASAPPEAARPRAETEAYAVRRHSWRSRVTVWS